MNLLKTMKIGMKLLKILQKKLTWTNKKPVTIAKNTVSYKQVYFRKDDNQQIAKSSLSVLESPLLSIFSSIIAGSMSADTIVPLLVLE